MAVAGLSLSACSIGSMFGGGTPSPDAQNLQNATASPAEIAAASPLPAIATECPPIKVRPGAEAVYYYGSGKIGNPKDLQYQAVIDKQSRNCVVSNGLITVKMGVVGRLMLGPAGNQTSVDLPLRFAVERGDASALDLRSSTRSPWRSRRLPRPTTSSRSSTMCRSPTYRATTSPSGSASTAPRSPENRRPPVNSPAVRLQDKSTAGETGTAPA